MDFYQIKPTDLADNAIKLIGTDWMLICAGSLDRFNMMTASWGGMGVLWNKPVSYIFVRPTRHTYGFIEGADHFTLNFFEETYRSVLQWCGSKSGRDHNKMKESGISAVKTGSGSVYFSESRLVLECRKLYFQDLDPEQFLDPAIAQNYPAKDYHRMYIGEITQCLLRR